MVCVSGQVFQFLTILMSDLGASAMSAAPRLADIITQTNYFPKIVGGPCIQQRCPIQFNRLKCAKRKISTDSSRDYDLPHKTNTQDG
jgi:hypothetical protein